MDSIHDPSQCVAQLRQTLAADKLSVGFFLGAGCPCSVRIPDEIVGAERPLIPDIKGMTVDVSKRGQRMPQKWGGFQKTGKNS